MMEEFIAGIFRRVLTANGKVFFGEEDRKEMLAYLEKQSIANILKLSPCALACVTQHGLSPSIAMEIDNLANNGQKISAIKMFRAETGVGLKDSKDFIDSFFPSLSSPPTPKQPESEEKG